MKTRVFAFITLFGVAAVAGAQPYTTVFLNESGGGYVIDESGHKSLLPGTANVMEPISGQSTLAYSWAASNLGDLVLSDPSPLGNGNYSDVIRFDHGATFFFSKADGLSAADQGIPPLQANSTFVDEGPTAWGNGALYVPASDEAGFVSGLNVQYRIASDVPAPGAALSAVVVLLGAFRRRRA
jgi:hypothetical protein